MTAERDWGAVRARERRGRRRGVRTWVARVVALGIVFFAGLAVGRALEEAPRPGGTQTLVRTLDPGTIPPATRTITVTTAGK